MLQSISSLGSILNKTEQESINGGRVGCKVIFDCPIGMVFSCRYCACVNPDPA
jgi:hypothetical protein